MKKNLSYLISFAVLLLGSCVSEQVVEVNPPAGPQGLMRAGILADVAEDDYVHTIRFIVFDNASTSPSLDVNEMITLPAGERNADKFTNTLKVSVNDDKMLVVLMNEPASMSADLERLTSAAALEDLLFGMAAAFNNDHTAPRTKGVPMSGVKRNISVTPANDTEPNALSVEMVVERAVARVELWMKRDAYLSYARINTATQVTLSRTYGEGYLAVGTVDDETRYQTGTKASYNFGHMLTADAPSGTVSWNYTEASTKELGTADFELITAFYTPERTCSAGSDADKLKLSFRGIETSAGEKTGEVTLNTFTGEDLKEQIIDTIKRNNVYRIFGLLVEDIVQFEASVLTWKEAAQGVIIDPFYSLKVSADDLRLAGTGDQASIVAETDYNRDDRGYPKGIVLESGIRYFDKNGNAVNSSAGDRYGWLTPALSGNPGDLVRTLTLTVTNPLSSNNTGCYALAGVQAGNMVKRIKVTRAAAP